MNINKNEIKTGDVVKIKGASTTEWVVEDVTKGIAKCIGKPHSETLCWYMCVTVLEKVEELKIKKNNYEH